MLPALFFRVGSRMNLRAGKKTMIRCVSINSLLAKVATEKSPDSPFPDVFVSYQKREECFRFVRSQCSSCIMNYIVSIIQWIFQVPVKGGRDYITP